MASSRQLASSASDTTFHDWQIISCFPGDLLPTFVRVSNSIQRFTKRQNDAITFDWTAFKKAIDGYKQDDILTTKHSKEVIAPEEKELMAFTDDVGKVLRDTFNISMIELELILFNALMTLKNERGYLQYYKQNPATKSSSWEYRIVVALPFGEYTTYMRYTVITLNITADVEDKEGWLTLEPLTRKKFGATIESMEVVAKQGFRAPI